MAESNNNTQAILVELLSLVENVENLTWSVESKPPYHFLFANKSFRKAFDIKNPNELSLADICSIDLSRLSTIPQLQAFKIKEKSIICEVRLNEGGLLDRIDFVNGRILPSPETVENSQNHLSEVNFLRSLLETQSNYVIRTDITGNYTFANDSFLKKIDFTLDEILGKPSMSTVCEIDHNICMEMVYQCLSSPGTVRPLKLRKPNPHDPNNPYLTEWEFIATIDEHGNPTGIQGVGHDLSEARFFEHQTELLINLINRSSEAIQVTDEAGNFIFLNKEAEKRLGFKLSDKPQINIKEVEIVFKGQGAWERHVSLLKKDGNMLLYGINVNQNTGEEFPVEVTANYLEISGKGYIMAFSRDITDRKKTENQIREKDLLLQRLSDQVPGMLFTFKISAEGHVTYPFVSSGAKDIFGRETKDLDKDASYVFQFVHPEDLQELQQSISESAEKLTPWYKEFRIVLPDGRTSWRMGSSIPERTPTGDTIWYGLLTNIDRQKETEYNLIQSKEAADAANHAKSEFLSMISHEIRTPLNAIMGTSYLLLNEEQRELIKEGVRTIQFSSRNLLAIINDILDYSKIEANKIELEKNTFSLNKLINNLIQGQTYKAIENGNKIIATLDEKLPEYLIGDQVRLGQILNNLLSNAVKFTRNGEVELVVRELSHDDKKIKLYFAVRDTGVGIPKDKQERIFERFQQANVSNTREFGGTGLGLSITKRLLNLMDSEIHLESDENEGATFYFEATFEINTSQDNSAVQAEAADDTNKNLSAAKILMAEDNQVNALLAKKFILKWNGQVDVAENGVKALEKAFQDSYDLILMDIQMPEMNGLEATAELRSRGVKIPILAISAAAMSEMKEQALQAGMNDFIAKPFEPNHLYLKLKQYLNQ